MSGVSFTRSAETNLLELRLHIAEANPVAADEPLDVIQAAVSGRIVDAAHGPDGRFFQRIFQPGGRFATVKLGGSEQAFNCSSPFA